MFGYQQTAYNYGTYASANGQQATGYPTGTSGTAAITPLGTAANAYANSQYSFAAANAYANYSQAAQQQQQQQSTGTANYGMQPPPPPSMDYPGTNSGAYGVIGGGKPGSIKSTPATGSNAVSSHYAGYEAAVYAAASNYIQGKGQGSSGGSNWKSAGNKNYPKKRYGLGHQNRDMQQLFCELCKISCAGQAAYKDHMDGKPHKKKEQAAKEEANARGRVGFRCEVCEVTCSSKDTFDAHVKGQKHQRTIALLRRMGKPVPQTDSSNIGVVAASNEAQGRPIPTVGSSGPLKKVVGVTGTKFVGGTTLLTTGEELKMDSSSNPVATITGKPQDLEKMLLHNEDIKPVGQEFIEEEKDSFGKFLTYLCKLCDCKFSDKGAKDVHLKGRRHRLQYKQKVDPSLKVEAKPAWNAKGKVMSKPAYSSGTVPFQPPFQQARPLFPMARSHEVMDDKHVLQKLQEIHLTRDELGNVERLALLVEKTLKAVSDAMINARSENLTTEQTAEQRVLKGVMRVGLLAKHLLIKTDTQIDLVVLCADIPTVSLLKKVAELFRKNAEIPENEKLTVTELVDQAAISVSLSSIASMTCRVTLTSVVLREGNQQAGANDAKVEEITPPTDPLPKDPCLNALAELRHAKFYQVKCSPLHSLNLAVKIVRDICNRVRTWSPLNTWTVVLLVEKTLSSISMPLSPGDAIRRLFEVVSSGVFLSKRSKLPDPCEKEPVDVLGHISDQEREDITSSAQHALRLIAYNQIYKILAIERLPDSAPPLGAKSGQKRAHADGSSLAGVGQEISGQSSSAADRPSVEGRMVPADAPDAKRGKIEPREDPTE